VAAVALFAGEPLQAAGQLPDCFHYGCGPTYFPEHPCQCNAMCVSHNNCCGDYHLRCIEQKGQTLVKPKTEAEPEQEHVAITTQKPHEQPKSVNDKPKTEHKSEERAEEKDGEKPGQSQVETHEQRSKPKSAEKSEPKTTEKPEPKTTEKPTPKTTDKPAPKTTKSKTTPKPPSQPPAQPAAPPPPAAATAATPPPPPHVVEYNGKPADVLYFDMYRAMASSAVDSHLMEDDDMADLGGVIKYIHTEILTEHMGDPLRTSRKYNIDVLTRHRYKIHNTDKLLKSPVMAQAEFGQFVTYDWGQATNTQQMAMFQQYGDFVGVQTGCSNLHCDVRFPSELPYSWFSVGNWCPNLPWDKKGTKANPNPACLREDGVGVVKGGLCPGGFDKLNFIPGVEPTGQPGCVYSYGKAEVVKLDELVGITAQECDGGIPCKDWLHFRQNCTDPKFKRKFLPNGQITNVDYCVEFDIHPLCDNCDAAPCQGLLKSGQEAYLGLAFWSGRCDGRANVRRMEQAAKAFGIAGALKTHTIVDDALLARADPCPFSKGTSWACAPEIAGMSGPMCTRSFNGACQQCYIPGTVQGPDPPPRPFCPFDIFSTPGYADRINFPIPKCKTKRAGDGCCLYAGNCDGVADPSSATLDDDGFALVASRRSTVDMQVFLKRAAQGTGVASAASNEDALKWAAYFAWENGPIDRTLAQALDELARFNNAPVVTETSASATQLESGCFEDAVSFMPLDMDGTVGSVEVSAGACQRRCAAQHACRHFSFMKSPGSASGFCHLHDFTATVQLGSVGYVSGPYECWSDIKDTSTLIDKGHGIYVTSDFACMEWGWGYSPTVVGGMRLIAPNDGSSEQAVLSCQQMCAENPSCKHFSISFPSRACSLSGLGAMRMSMMGAISGPPKCQKKDMQAYYRLFEQAPGSLPQVRRRFLHGSISCALVLACAIAVLAVVKVRRVSSRPFNVVPTDESIGMLATDDAVNSLISSPI